MIRNSKVATLLTAISLCVVGVFTAVPAKAAPPPPTFTFTFDDYGNATFPNQTSSTAVLTPAANCPGPAAGPCNATSAFGTDPNYGTYWEWTSTNSRGGGFTVDTTGVIGDSYSIAMSFTLAQVTGWRKIIDYLNRTSDTGFYVLSGALQFYPKPTANFTFAPNQLINIVVVRDATTNPSAPTFNVYLAGPNGTYSQVYSFVDSTSMGVPYSTNGHTILGFFFDDLATSGEASNAARIYDLRMWQNTVLTSSDLNDVYLQATALVNSTPTSTPQPSSPSVVSSPSQTPELAQTGTSTTLLWSSIGLIVMGLLAVAIVNAVVRRQRKR